MIAGSFSLREKMIALSGMAPTYARRAARSWTGVAMVAGTRRHADGIQSVQGRAKSSEMKFDGQSKARTLLSAQGLNHVLAAFRGHTVRMTAQLKLCACMHVTAQWSIRAPTHSATRLFRKTFVTLQMKFHDTNFLIAWNVHRVCWQRRAQRNGTVGGQRHVDQVVKSAKVDSNRRYPCRTIRGSA